MGDMTGEVIALSAPAERSDDMDRQVDDAHRLGLLFDTHRERLYRLARRMCRTSEDARDMVQEAFLRAARSPHSVPRGQPNEEAWLVRVLINVARDRWRKTAVRARHDAVALDGADRSAHPESALIARSTVWAALGRLAPRRRAILVMYELEGATIPSIAKMLGVTPVTVRWHLSMGRRELAKAVRGTS